MPLAHTIVVQAAGPKRLGRVMGVIAVPAQLAPIIGPVIGGVIVDSISWRWIFYVNVSLCLAALALARFMEEETGPGPRRPRPALPWAGGRRLRLLRERVSRRVPRAAGARPPAGEPADAFATAFWWALGLTALALVPALLLPARAPE